MAKYRIEMTFSATVDWEEEAESTAEALNKAKATAQAAPRSNDQRFATIKAYVFGPRGGGPTFAGHRYIDGAVRFEAKEWRD